MDEAIAFAQAGYKSGTRVNAFTGDLKDIEASVSSAICACRGMCGSHTGPCSMQSSQEIKGTKMCKACAMSAGGPGSGRKETGKKMSMLDEHNDLRLAVRTAARYGTEREVAVAKRKLSDALGKKVEAGGPGSGRHITTTVHSNPELGKTQADLKEKGFKFNRSKSDANSGRHEFDHSDGSRVTVMYIPKK